jgi:hypothetical protein
MKTKISKFNDLLIARRLEMMVLFTLLFSATAQGQITTLEGTVKTSDGKALEKVSVYFSIHRGVETNQDGKFALDRRRERVVGFSLKGYKPLFKIIDEDSKHLDVVLEREPPDSLVIAKCEANRKYENGLMFGGIWLKFPLTTSTKKISDIDYDEQFIGYGQKDSQEFMVIMNGALASGGKPLDRVFLASREFSAGMIKVGEYEMVDLKGIAMNGKRWRWVGGVSFIKYEDVSDAAANYFDNIINRACL